MDILVYCIQWAWKMFMSISFPIVFQGVTYNITLYALLIFTTVVGIVAVLIAKAFE